MGWVVPFIENNEFKSFNVSDVQISKSSIFQSFKDSRIHLICLLIDVDLIFQIFKNLLDGSSGFVDSCLFQNLKEVSSNALFF